MTVENVPTGDSLALSSPPPTSDLSPDWKCDVDGGRLNAIERRSVSDITYEIRQCSVDPSHLKMQPV